MFRIYARARGEGDYQESFHFSPNGARVGILRIDKRCGNRVAPPGKSWSLRRLLDALPGTPLLVLARGLAALMRPGRDRSCPCPENTDTTWGSSPEGPMSRNRRMRKGSSIAASKARAISWPTPGIVISPREADEGLAIGLMSASIEATAVITAIRSGSPRRGQTAHRRGTTMRTQFCKTELTARPQGHTSANTTGLRGDCVRKG